MVAIPWKQLIFATLVPTAMLCLDMVLLTFLWDRVEENGRCGVLANHWPHLPCISARRFRLEAQRE